ncbi:hypothetical protein AB0C52_16105 [Streptomyces sp. NPDC048717]|uniref:DUF7507 domain-containing protein n=1 Tax=Streptomyces sp. NPDC048717 TaxID=3154928 RepID=UPI00343B4A45
MTRSQGTSGGGAGRRRRFRLWAAVLGLVATVLVGSGAPTAAQEDWDCLGGPETRIGYLFQEGAASAAPYSITQIDYTTGAGTVVAGTPVSVDAVGFNTLDGYYYGIAANNLLVRIDSSGNTTQVGTVGGSGYSSGDFDANGHLWILGNILPGAWAEIDLAPGSPTYGQTLATGSVTYPGNQYRALGDWTFMTGPAGTGLYGIADMVGQRLPNLLFFNTVTRVFTVLGEVAGMPVGIGGVDTRGSFTDGVNLYVYTYTSGAIYRVPLNTRVAVQLPQSPGAATYGDGAQCAAAPTSTINVVKEIDGRNAPVDQFRAALRNAQGIEVGAVTTSGTETRAESGPLDVLSAQTYELTDRPAGGSMPPGNGLYDTSAHCVNDETGAELPLTGGGGSWSLTLSRLSASYTCTVTNRARGTANLQLVKHASPTVATQVGQTVTYTLTVRNTGDTSIQNLDLTDSQQTGTTACDLPAGGLLPGHDATCATLTHTVTQADLENGLITNNAQVEGADNLGHPVSATASARVYTVQPSPDIEMTKSVTPDTVTAAGQSVTYTYHVTNSGPTELHGVNITEHGFSGTGTPPQITCGQTTLDPGASTDCTATYTVTQADIDAGGVDNTATARGLDPLGTEAVSQPSSAHVTATRTPAITLAKAADPSTVGSAGTQVTYKFTLTNTGNTTVTNADVVDTAFTGHGQLGILDCPGGSDRTLGPGEHLNCSATYTVTQPDIDQGGFDNTAHAVAWSNGAEVTSADAQAHVTTTRTAQLSLIKQASPDDTASFTVDREVTYSFLVRNTGNVSVSGLDIVETAFTGHGPAPDVVCPAEPTLLQPDRVIVCQATYTLTQADIDQGTVTNTAHATATAVGGETVDSNEASQTLVGAPGSALDLHKSADPTSVDTAGQTVTYTFHVTNTGETTLNALTIIETHFTGTGTAPQINCPVTSLAPGASTDCTGTYQVTQTDLDAGGVTNSAVASADTPAGEHTHSEISTVTVDAHALGSLSIQKTVDPDVVTGAGDTVTYHYTVRNTGGVTLNSVTVTDTAFSGSGTPPAVTCPVEALAPGYEKECTAAYTVTPADVTAGTITNTATATGARADTAETVTSNEDHASVRIATSSLGLTKSVSPDSATVGDQVTYTYTVTNTGETALTDLVVTDTEFSGTGSPPAVYCPQNSLDAGQSVTCEATYTVTAADTQPGHVTNTATATARNSAGTEVTSAAASASLTTQGSSLGLTKSVSPTSATVGDQVTYTYTVTNTGETDLTDLTVADTEFSGSGTPPDVVCPVTHLAPGAVVTCEATYVVTAADVTAGQVTNTATATALTGTGTPITSGPASASFTTHEPPPSSLALTKSVSPATAHEGDQVTYTYVATNTGETALSNLVVADTAFSGTGTPPSVDCPGTTLNPGASMTCTATYTVTAADVAAGQVTNTATATAQNPSGAAVESEPATALLVTPASSLGLTKSVSPSTATTDDQVTYSYEVTNTGETTLTGVSVADTAFSGTGTPPTVTCPATTLDAGASMTCTATYTVTDADAQAGQVTNTAVATARNPSGTAVESEPANATLTTHLPPVSSLALEKSVSPDTATTGDHVTYTYTVTNTGETTLTGVSVADTAFSGTGIPPSISCPTGPLAPGASVACTAVYVVTAADAQAGQVTNTAAATAQSPAGAEVTSEPATATLTTHLPPVSSLALTKTVAPATATVGDQVTYTYVVTNTGETNLTNLLVRDVEFTGTGTPPNVICPATSLAPGASVTCEATYVVSAADVTAGQVTNTARATADNPTGAEVESPAATASFTTHEPPVSSLGLTKSVSPTSATVGDQVTYTYVATNTGETALSALSVADTAFSGTGTAPLVVCPATTLAPGASVTCEATYVVTEADVTAGQVTNTAVATAQNPSGAAVTSAEAHAVFTTHAPPASSLALTKSVSPATATVGDQVTYTYVATNTGETALSGLSVADTAFSGTGTPSVIDCPATSLAPGASVTCTSTYAVTEADVTAGQVTNTAVATAQNPSGVVVTSAEADAVFTTHAPPTSSLGLTKSVSPGTATVGDQVTYTYVATNTGETALSSLVVADTAFSGTGTAPVVVCPATTLAPGASVTCEATYVVTEADVTAGEVTNTAHATAQNPSGAAVESEPATASFTTHAPPASSLALTKSVSPQSATVGDQVTYTYVATNTGETALSALSVTDTEFSGTGTAPVIECPGTTLAPDASVTCTATYVVTEADVTAGEVTNTAQATAENPSGAAVNSAPATALLTTHAPPTSSLALTKSVSPQSATVGDQVTYTYVATNTGETALSSLVVADTEFSGTGTAPVVICPETTLAPGASVTCEATYVVTEADVTAGQVTNTAHATAQNPSGAAVESEPATASFTTHAPPASSLALTKSVSPQSATVGDQVTYTYVATNTGETALSALSVTDTEFSGSGTAPVIDCPGTTLAPGASVTCTGTYVVTEADVTAGEVTNTAQATAENPSGTAVNSAPATALLTTHAPPASSLAFTKSVSPETATVGDQVTYTYVATNTGETALSSLVVADTAFSGTGTAPVVLCPATSLAPGASVTCEATYVVTEADVTAGQVTNTAQATAENPSGTAVHSEPATASFTTHAPPASSLALTKSVTPTTATLGDQVTYTYVATNTGETALSALSVTDTEFSGSGTAPVIDCPATSLAPGASVTCTATYVVTEADVTAGEVTNTATATAQNPSGTAVHSAAATALLLTHQPPASSLSLTKTVDPHTATTGDQVTYTYVATNTGETALSGLVVADTAFSGTGTAPVVDCPETTLAPGASVTCTATYVVTEADVTAGEVTNTATATAQDPSGAEITSGPASAVLITHEGPPPASLGLTKSVSPAKAGAGDEVTYTYTVTNTGGAALTGLTVADTAFSGTGTPPSVSCPETTLAPGASVTCTATYVVTEEDVTAGKVTNTATASAETATGTKVTSEAASAVLVTHEGPPVASLGLTKSVSPKKAGAGDDVTYTYVATNTGDTALTGLEVADTAFSGTGTPPSVSCPETTLAPGASVTCTAKYTVTEEDAKAGEVTNTATASAETTTGTEVTSDPASAVLVTRHTPPPGDSLKLKKTAEVTDTNHNGVNDPGDIVTWTLKVTNTGSGTLHDIRVDDPVAGPVTCPPEPLAPGATMICAAPPYTLREEDAKRGHLTNTAIARGTNDAGRTVSSRKARVTIPVQRGPKPPYGGY